MIALIAEKRLNHRGRFKNSSMEGGWRYTMRSSPENVDTEYDWRHIMETHGIMYLVKRSLYEFCFAVPTRQVRHLSEERPLL